ncbi:hypothetical protein MNBD_GAMMA24-1545 [hydrothermal vent metagenome]|uniref:Uncharacterized protein n=1 Tax=hydrothermal vent metagenome TaxID=652676 RepID=A0A3B1BNM6_9ZZZZ
MQIELLLQTIILPLLLSLAVYKIAHQHTTWLTTGLFFAWLPAYLWILLPNWPPTEAVDWLWLAGVAFLSIQLIPNNTIKIPYLKTGQLAIFTLALLLISLPLLQYALTSDLIIELLLVLLAASILVIIPSSSPAPAFILSMNATALAVCTALSGTLLVAQLAGALAAAPGIFAINELIKRLASSRLQASALLPLALLYLLLLTITRLYADLPTGPALLLLLAPLSLRLKNRSVIGLSLLTVVIATAWLLMLQDSNSYY